MLKHAVAEVFFPRLQLLEEMGAEGVRAVLWPGEEVVFEVALVNGVVESGLQQGSCSLPDVLWLTSGSHRRDDDLDWL